MVSPPASPAAPARTRGRARSGVKAQAETLPQLWEPSLDELPRAMQRASVVAGVVLLASVLLLTLVAVHLGAHTLVYPRPVIQVSFANASATIHAGDTLHFSAHPTAGRQLAYTWDFGDGAGAKGTQVAHAYATFGYYAVTCEAVDPMGQRGSAQVTVTVVPPAPQAKASVAHDSSYNYLVTVDGSASTGIDLHYYWDFGDGATSSSGLQPTATHYYQHPGVYGLTLTVVDVAGQSSMTTVQVTVSTTAFH